MRFRKVPALWLGLLLSGCAAAPKSDSLPIPAAWLSVPQSRQIRSLSLSADGRVAIPALDRPAPATQIHVRDNRIYNGSKALTPAYKAIESFDVSTQRGEVVFSAKRDATFDIGLVSTDGSDVHWVPEEPRFDEVQVQWAPRGNKISYVIRAAEGDLIRTVHIPTSTALTVEVPYGTVHAIAYDPQAEHFAVAYDSLTASDAVDVMKYGGEERRTAVAPAAKLDAEVEPFAGDAVILRPPALRYNEKLPLVVWVVKNRNAWSDARASLMHNARIASAVTTQMPDAAFWERVRQTRWLDPERTWVVAADPAVPTGRYRTKGNVILAPPAVVESLAAGLIADRLKGTPPPNGR